MDAELLRKRLIEARLSKNYNRKQFAEALGVPYRTVTNYENGSREPGSDYITKVANFCGCTTDWLLGRSDENESKPVTNLDDVAQEFKLNPKERVILEKFVRLSPEARNELLKFFIDIADAINTYDVDGIPAGTPAMPKKEMTAEELHAELDRQLKAEETAKEKSGAS